jgi:hypothetical protein
VADAVAPRLRLVKAIAPTHPALNVITNSTTASLRVISSNLPGVTTIELVNRSPAL